MYRVAFWNHIVPLFNEGIYYSQTEIFNSSTNWLALLVAEICAAYGTEMQSEQISEGAYYT